MNREFVAAETELQTGFTLIEASAGTGKTTTICAIVLRLIAEQKIAIEKILVTTYTELATAELRGRIREIIATALRFSHEHEVESELVRAVVAKVADRPGLIRRLETALQNFDEAPIFTIHGFCTRVLSDRAFESGALFEMELTTDQSEFVHEIADDFWRMHFHLDESPVAELMRGRLTVGDLIKLLDEIVNNPAVRIIPAPEDLVEMKRAIVDAPARGAGDAEMETLADRLVVALPANFCAWARRELRRRKDDRQLQSYDDLLTRLEEALRGKSGQTLRQSLRARFAVALIDEFQDTDPVQYSIFRQIYEGSEAPVFFIGDPKQAIYGFRGADVFTYLEAAASADRTYTLGQNWRSEAKLTDGVSSLFQERPDPFVLEGIDLPEVTASGRGDAKPFMSAGRREPPLQLWISPPEQKGDVDNVVASEIARLLTTETRIGEERIRPRDIAILVSNNTEPLRLQEALLRRKIPSVVYSAASVFQSHEAEELLRLLRGVSDPTREPILRAALSTELLGHSANALESMIADEAQWDAILNRFADYHLLWRDRGFVEMIRAIILREQVRGRLLAFPDGERRLTNLLHLIDLLHAACAEHRFGMDSLIAWFAPRTRPEAKSREEDELRLESDEDAVRIVTIHKSKGLEYGVTFMPFARKEPFSRGKYLKFHREGELVLDLAHDPANKQRRELEELAELTRHIYVGLTRAEHRCYVLWQDRTSFKKPSKSKSALAWLFAPEIKAERFLAHGEIATSQRLREKFSDSETITVAPMPEPTDFEVPAPDANAETWKARKFRGEIDRSWAVTSFSALAEGKKDEPEFPDYDSSESVLETEPLLPAEGIHAFPGGTRAGTCLHKILEEVDFNDLSLLPTVVSERLRQFRIEGFDQVITETLSRTLQKPLGSSEIVLAQTAGRLSELEFTFPLSLIKAARLQETLATGEVPGTIGRLQFQPTRGFLKGFIDLVFEYAGKFYFLDWKSNWLGPDASFYAAEDLTRVMQENSYGLQLSIYSVALHRYLRRRIKNYEFDRHFGGAFYVFLRGLNHPSGGVLQARPQLAFVDALDQLFHGNA